jgi:hypothetical protein
MLVRVSTVEPANEHAYRVQARFIDQMLDALPPKGRNRLLGAATSRG